MAEVSTTKDKKGRKGLPLLLKGYGKGAYRGFGKMKRTDSRMEKSLFGAWVLRILKEC